MKVELNAPFTIILEKEEFFRKYLCCENCLINSMCINFYFINDIVPMATVKSPCKSFQKAFETRMEAIFQQTMRELRIQEDSNRHKY